MSAAAPAPIRVLVAEDSSTVRRLLVELLRSDPAFTVVGEAADGVEAIEKARTLRPDLITMDVQMPLLDGLDATKAIMREAPAPILIVSSVASRGDVGLALSATQAGALMVVAKPAGPRSPEFEEQCRHFLAMAKAMARVKVVRRWRDPDVADAPPAPRARAARPPRLVAIGTSTGGPAALHRILIDLPGDFGAPIAVVQHMARGFIGGLASWLAAGCALRVAVAEDGEPLLPGGAYLAPDGVHLGVGAGGGGLAARLLDRAPVGGFRPSADVLFAEAAAACGPALLALTLTGMGRDGVDGLAAVRRAGGTVLAQDEASSVVFGMAQEAIRAGVVDEVLPLAAIPRRLLELAERR